MNNKRRGKPYLGMGVRGEIPMEGLIHGLTPEEFLALLTQKGEPLLFSSTMEVPVGTIATFFNGVKGVVVRRVTIDDFLAWEQRLFPGCQTMLVPQDRCFVEVRVD